MFCSRCGKQINDSSKFCEFCGAPISETGNVQQTTAAGDPTKNKLAIAGMVLGIICSMIILLGVVNL